MEQSQMKPRHPTPIRKRTAGTILAVIGISVWVTAVVLRITPADARDVSFAHMEARLLGIVAGGAAVAGGIVLIAAS
jgi:hypothetical protein